MHIHALDPKALFQRLLMHLIMSLSCVDEERSLNTKSTFQWSSPGRVWMQFKFFTGPVAVRWNTCVPLVKPWSMEPRLKNQGWCFGFLKT